MTDKEIEFLKGLTELTMRTGIEISGCGCCGSPFVDKVHPAQLNEDHHYYSEHGDSITWKRKIPLEKKQEK